MQPKGGDSVEIWTRRLNELFTESQETYRDIAKATGIPISAIHRYVTGETENIPLDRLEKLASHFGVKTEYLAGWDREPDAVDRKVLEIDPNFVPGKNYLPDKSRTQNPKLAILFKRSRALSDKQLDIVNSIVNEMVSEDE